LIGGQPTNKTHLELMSGGGKWIKMAHDRVNGRLRGHYSGTSETFKAEAYIIRK
jgi:hypothetical protein